MINVSRANEKFLYFSVEAGASRMSKQSTAPRPLGGIRTQCQAKVRNRFRANPSAVVISATSLLNEEPSMTRPEVSGVLRKLLAFLGGHEDTPPIVDRPTDLELLWTPGAENTIQDAVS